MNLLASKEITPAIRKWKPYLSYRDSGVEWLGTIPEHWKIKRLKFIATVNMGQSPDSEDCNVFGEGKPFLQGNGEFGEIHPSPKLYCPAAKKRASPDDILLSVRAPVGALNVADQEYGIGRGLCAIAPHRDVLSNQYARYLLEVVRLELNSIATGSTYEAVSVDEVKSLLCVQPSVREQERIAEFLDREMAKIDALVAKKERLIELLQEKRAALITRAVTKGLDPNVPMKDSGVEWLGETPAHWASLALSRVTLSRCDGPFGSGLKSEHYSGDGVRVIRLQNIGWTEFLDQDRAYIDEEYASKLGDHSVVSDDLLVAGLGDEGHPVGRACVAPHGIGAAMVKADCFRFRLDRRRVFPRFAAYQLSATALAAGGSLATGATRARMNLTTTANRKIALPPLDEQRIIVEVLNRETEKHLALIAKIREGIDKLKEYRTALISAAVTGKIDVRGEMAA